jgi:hypothetical protein
VSHVNIMMASTTAAANSTEGDYFTSRYKTSDTGSYLFPALTPLLVIVFLSALCLYLKHVRILGFEHRRFLSRMAELLCLSQLLLVTAALEELKSVYCDPDVLIARLGSAWRENNGCSEMTIIERAAVDCAWEGTMATALSYISIYTAFMSVCVVLAHSFKEDRPIQPAVVAAVNVLLLINASAWLFVRYFALYHRGPCTISQSSVSAAELFYNMSIGLVVAEYFIPNKPSPQDLQETCTCKCPYHQTKVDPDATDSDCDSKRQHQLLVAGPESSTVRQRMSAGSSSDALTDSHDAGSNVELVVSNTV